MAKTIEQYKQEIEELRTRLLEAEETLEAIRTGAVDAIVVSQGQEEKIFTLQGMETAYRILLEKLSEGTATLSADGGIVYCNARFAEMLGLSLDQVLGTRLEKHVVSTARRSLAGMLRQAAEGESRGEIQFRGRGRQGVPVYVSMAALSGNPPAAISMVATDLTERKQAEEVLASEQFIRRLIDNAPIGVAVVGQDLRYILANPAYQSLAAEPDVSVVGRTIAQVFAPPVAQIVEPFVRQVLESGQPLELKEYEAPVRGRTWWNVSEIPLRDAAGHVEAVLILTEEVTERRQAEEAVRQSEARYRMVVENTTAVILRVDPGGVITFANGRALEFFGYSAEELIGQPALGTIVPKEETSGRNLAALVEEIRKEPDRFHTNANENICKDGRRVWMEWTNSGVYDADGRLKEFLCVGIDATQRKQAEQELRQWNQTLEVRVAERTAEASSRAEQLQALAAQLTNAEQKERERLASVLHDHLQQLLVGTKFHLGILRGQGQNPDLRQSLAEIDGLLDQSLETCRNLTVDLSPPILVHGTMTQVLRWLADWMRSKHGLRVNLQADEQANPRSYEVRVLLFQAAKELLFNIVKHAKVDEATVDLCRPDDQHVQVTVRDKGAGFDPQARRRNANGGGSGFGLLAIRERLNWLNGTLRINSKPGKGTRAVLTAPMVLPVGTGRSTESTDAVSQASHDTHTTQPASCHADNRIRVLLADDHVVMRDGLGELLRGLPDMEVVGKAADGQEAVDMALQLRPDIIIMDITMPQMDGIEATRRIKARHPEIQVIGLSMFNDEGAAKGMEEAGASGYAAKTSGPDAVIDLIHRCTRGQKDSPA